MSSTAAARNCAPQLPWRRGISDMKMIVQSQKAHTHKTFLPVFEKLQTANYSWLKTRQAKANQNNKNNNDNNNTRQQVYIVDALFIRRFFSIILTLFQSLNRLVIGI